MSKSAAILKTGCFLLAGLVLLTAGPQSWSYPTPALVPPPGTWQLDLELHGDPQQIEITLPGENEPRRYWYFLYTITNNTGQTVEFYPQFELFTDTFKLYRSGTGVRRPVFEAIRNRYAARFPLLEPEELVAGRILQGEDNARDSVVIFPDFDPQANGAKVFIAGLSNETATVAHPIKNNPATCRPLEVLLRKTLELQYQVPGDPYNPENRVMLYRNRRWIMR